MYGWWSSMLNTYAKETAQNKEAARNEIISKMKNELEKAQGKMKMYYDQGRQDVSFELWDFMYLKLQLCRHKSLNNKFNVKLLQWYE